MLSVDHVRAYRRGQRLILRELTPEDRERARRIAGEYLEIAADSDGVTRKDFDELCAATEVHPRDRKLAAGLLKLVSDRCTFEMAAAVDPMELRRAVFESASAARAALPAGVGFEPEQILAEVAAEHDLEPDTVHGLLFADLKGAHRLVDHQPTTPEQLLATYELGQAQALLLRATHVTATVRATHAAAYRTLFHKLKFLRLLHQIHRDDDEGYRIEIEGPFTMFGASTKYGLQLALALPVLRECDEWSIEAEVLWGKERRATTFTLAGERKGDQQTPRTPPLADDLARLLKRLKELDTPWRASRSRSILDLPGVGLCVPDFVFTHADSKAKVYFESLGYWSRDAVWKRVALVEAGLATPIIFAVSDRLRVSKEALGQDRPGSLYVYKGVMNANAIVKALDDLVSR